MKKIVCLFAFFVIFSKSAFAFYPEKTDYPFNKNPIDVYVGMSIGSMVSETFGSYPGKNSSGGNSNRYQALWNPSYMLSSGLISGNVGVRFFDNKNIFLNNFRVEAQMLYVFNQQSYINDTTYQTSAVNTDNYPATGQEVLSKAGSVVLLYDMRHWSQTFYPYIGFGVGVGTFKYRFYDTKQQPNGLGEQYNGTSTSPFGQASLGVMWSNKIIKSSFYLEYKAITSFGNLGIDPLNDGIHDGKNPDDSPFPTTPSTSHKDVRYFTHGIVFGFQYYVF